MAKSGGLCDSLPQLFGRQMAAGAATMRQLIDRPTCLGFDLGEHQVRVLRLVLAGTLLSRGPLFGAQYRSQSELERPHA